METFTPSSPTTTGTTQSPVVTTPQKPPPVQKTPPSSSKTAKPRQRRIRSELDRLLSDEGTRNLLKNLKKKPTKKQQQQKKEPVFRTRVLGNAAAATTTRTVLNNTRVFRNGIRGRKVGRNSRGNVIVTETKAIPNNGPLNNSSSSSSSRSASPSKDVASVIDFKYVSVNRRNGVAFVTVTSNGNSAYTSINNNKGEDHGGGGSSGNSSGGGIDKVVLNEGSWGLKVLQSVGCAFRTLEQDSAVSVIVLQSTHSRFFCNGIDLSELLVQQKKMSNHTNSLAGIIKAIKSLITTLNASRKICVASISGDCVGFGLMLLPLFDFVYASDKTMFSLKYNSLGQSPEGLGLMQNLIRNGVGCSKLTNLLYLNTPLTATEAFESGLVSEILWPSRYQEELASRLTTLSATSQLIMKTKSTIKSYRRSFKLTDLWSEFSQIESQWGSSAFQDNLRKQLVQATTTTNGTL